MHMKGLSFLTALCLLTAGIFGGCQSAEVKDTATAAQETSIVVTDSRGVDVTVPFPAQRIVCTLNSGLNDLYMLGAGDRVVGIDKWTYDTTAVYEVMSQIDPRIKNKSIPAVDGNVEAIIALNPDVVVMWAENPEIAALEAQGIPVIGMQINNFDQVYDKLRLMAEITGTMERADAIIEHCTQKQMDLNSILVEIPTASLKSSLFMWSEGQFAGSNSTGNSILEQSGLRNAAAEVEQENFTATMEQIVNWNPDVLVMWHSNALDPQDMLANSQWQDIAAVQNKAVLELPSNFYCDLWTVKYLNSIQIIALSFYPEYFTDMNLSAEEEAFIEFLYGQKL